MDLPPHDTRGFPIDARRLAVDEADAPVTEIGQVRVAAKPPGSDASKAWSDPVKAAPMPLARFIDPEEAAEVIQLLLSDRVQQVRRS